MHVNVYAYMHTCMHVSLCKCRPRYVQVPLMFIDLLFLSWIYLSLSSTIR